MLKTFSITLCRRRRHRRRCRRRRREHLIFSVFLVGSTLMSSTFVDMKILLHRNVSESQLSGLSACQSIQV